MGIREFDIAGNRLVIHELEDVCHPVTGRALTGSWIWDSALVLSHWLSNQAQTKFDFTDKTVVELGAGAGLPGLTAARLGASRVILTDIEPLVPGLKTNVEANGLGDRVSVTQHVWGSDDFCSQLDELGEVDLVLISDVFFDAAEMEALAKTPKRLCRKGTTVWAASELRPMTSECLIELASEGFEIVELATQLGEDFSDNSTRANSEVFAIFKLVLVNRESDSEKWSPITSWYINSATFSLKDSQIIQCVESTKIRAQLSSKIVIS